MATGSTTKVIPSRAPADVECAVRIKKLATYVSRNGLEFEQKVREKEAGNPLFYFLSDHSSEEYFYYQWMLFCTNNQYSEDQVNCMEEAHAHKIEWRAPSGALKLVDADVNKLLEMLNRNDGSKDFIKLIRKWVIEHTHSIVHIGVLFSDFARNLVVDDGCAAYAQLLHTAYVLNDVLYNAKSATSSGPYTSVSAAESPVNVLSLLLPYVTSVLHSCCLSSTDDAQREKVLRLVQLWTGKGFLTEAEGAAMQRTITSAESPPAIPPPVLVSPYLDSPLPSNAPAPTPAPPMPAIPSKPPGAYPPGLTEAQLTQVQAIQQKIQSQMLATQLMGQQSAGPQPPAPTAPPAPHPCPYPAHPGAPPQYADYGQYPFPPQQQGMYPPGPPGFFPAAPHGFQPPLGPPPHPMGHPFGGPPPPMPHATPMLDLARIPVGNMANIVKAAKKAGQPAHTTMDVMIFASHAAPHVEPGRVEVRVAEFYRQLEALLHPEEARAAAKGPHGTGTAPTTSGDVRRRPDALTSRSETGSREHRDEHRWEQYVPGYEEDKVRPSHAQDRDQPRGRKFPRTAGHATETQISEENVGHKLLRGLGWQQGSGLGAEGAGIVEPIRAHAASDRSGIGSGESVVPTLQDGSIDYAAYRKQLSSHYHTRFGDR